MAIHDGHRNRMRERIEQSGIEGLQSHEMLEYLLYAFIPRKDTNAIAHALINKFGSFGAVLNADAHSLEEVAGVTHNAALFLSELPEVFRRYISSVNTPKTALKGRGTARAYMQGLFLGSNVEQVVIAALDAHEQIISCEKIAEGKGDAVAITVRDVVSFALRHQATSILFAHNHPSGSVNPSQNDYNFTLEIYSTLKSVGVRLDDHFIFGGADYYSFEESGKLAQIKELAQQSLKDGVIFYD